MEITAYLKKKQAIINTYLRDYIASKKRRGDCPEHLRRAMAYSLLAGGKRIRAILSIASFETSGKRSGRILPVAASLELIHTYSLIHDDLPAMDNDDFRRNRLTNHRVFGEGAAILAGDALLTEAFGMVAGAPGKSGVLNAILSELAFACGPEGMVGGQMADILSERKRISSTKLYFIHTRKTGALIRASVRSGALMAGSPPAAVRALTIYGERLGLAYQITDDILDVTGSKKELGKRTGADASRGKNTFPALFGLEGSQRKAESLVEGALASIRGFDSKADPLREIAQYMVRRRN